MRKASELFRVEPEVFRIGVDKVTEHRENIPGLPEMFREVPEGLWKYPEGYGTLLDAEIEPRPSRKVHKVVGRWEKGFLGGQGRHAGARCVSTQGRHAGTRGVSCLD